MPDLAAVPRRRERPLDYWPGTSTYNPRFTHKTGLPEVQTSITRRIREYRWAVELGWFPDIATARRMDLAAWAKQKVEREQWQRAECLARRWRRLDRRFAFNRAVLLAWPRRCAYCGARATCADHIIPRCQGGTDDYANLTPACGPCNGSKGGRTPEQWQAWRAEKGLCWPPAGAIWTGAAA